MVPCWCVECENLPINNKFTCEHHLFHCVTCTDSTPLETHCMYIWTATNSGRLVLSSQVLLGFIDFWYKGREPIFKLPKPQTQNLSWQLTRSKDFQSIPAYQYRCFIHRQICFPIYVYYHKKSLPGLSMLMFIVNFFQQTTQSG